MRSGGIQIEWEIEQEIAELEEEIQIAAVVAGGCCISSTDDHCHGPYRQDNCDCNFLLIQRVRQRQLAVYN
ncbi:hypothetical protein KCU59_g13, partial [Aureobasidium melanogenum]